MSNGFADARAGIARRTADGSAASGKSSHSDSSERGSSRKRIALLGGTFDPPHNGHLYLAQGVCDALHLSRLLLLPTGNPHFKLDQDVTPAKDRVAMTELLAQEDSRLQVSRLEAEREGITYTADTLALLAGLHPEEELLFVVGADCLDHIWRWRRAEEVAQLCTVVAVTRPGHDMSAAIQKLDARNMGFKVQGVNIATPGISSTQVRELARLGGALEGLVPASVERYIREHGIYQTQSGDCARSCDHQR